MKEATNERAVEAVKLGLAIAKARWTAGERYTQEAVDHFLASPALEYQAQAALAAARPLIMEEAAGIAEDQETDGATDKWAKGWNAACSDIAHSIRTAAKTEGGGS